MYARILVPIDGSGTAERGLDEAIALARRLGSTLRILHVADARMLGAAGFACAPPEQAVDDWRIADERLVPAAVDGLPRLLSGSDAEFVLRESPVPVLLVRGRARPEQAAGAACPIGAARS